MDGYIWNEVGRRPALVGWGSNDQQVVTQHARETEQVARRPIIAALLAVNRCDPCAPIAIDGDDVRCVFARTAYQKNGSSPCRDL